jgi:hypothetical protein
VSLNKKEKKSGVRFQYSCSAMRSNRATFTKHVATKQIRNKGKAIPVTGRGGP